LGVEGVVEVGVGVVEKERYRDGRMCRLRW